MKTTTQKLGLTLANTSTILLQQFELKSTEAQRAFALEITDSAMSPRLNEGDVVLSIDIPRSEWANQCKGVYAISIAGSFIIRCILSNDLTSSNTIVLTPANPAFGGEVTISGAHVQRMMRCKRIISAIVE